MGGLNTMVLPMISAGISVAQEFVLSSPTFKPNAMLTEQQVFNGSGCTGKNISPALTWTPGPKGTRSYAVTAFDPDAALERAMHVFWAKGYEGASLSNLTRAMRINRPSLYAAFGNKEELFRKVLDRYMDGPLAYFGKALAAPRARDVVEQILLGAANMPSDPRVPAGCLVVQGALACGDTAGSVRKEIAALRAAAKAALRRRLQRAKREGDLPKNADPAELSHYVMTVLHGMAVQGADGANRDQLRRVAQIAMRAWPKR